jgi:hypothetical protein
VQVGRKPAGRFLAGCPEAGNNQISSLVHIFDGSMLLNPAHRVTTMPASPFTMAFHDRLNRHKTSKMSAKRPEPVLLTNFFSVSAKKIEKSFAQ